MLELTRALTSEVEQTSFLERLLSAGCSLKGADHAAVVVGGDVDQEAELLASVGIDDDATRAILLAMTPGRSPSPRGLLTVPITLRGQRRGDLCLGWTPEDIGSTPSAIGIAGVLAELAAASIDRTQLSEQLAEQRGDFDRAIRGLRTAMEIATAVGSETDLPRILELIVNRGRSLVDADSLLIWLRQDDVLRIAAVAGNAAVPPDSTISLETSTAGAALGMARSVRIEDVRWMQVDPARFGMSQAQSALIVPLVHRGRGHGVLMAFDHHETTASFDADDQRTLEAFAASAATAVATAQSVEERRLRDTMAAAESERRVWARELHDETLQGLASLKLGLAGALRADPDRARVLLELASTQLDQDIASLRAIIADLRPAALDELGLEPALRTLVARIAEESGLDAMVAFALGRERLDPDVETIAYRVAQEALTNVVKHAGAETVTVDVRIDRAGLRLTVTDDGCGIGEMRRGGFGVVGMRERAALASGSVEITPLPGGGTCVTLTLPLG